MKINRQSLEKDVLDLGKRILAEASEDTPSPFNPEYYTEIFMSLGMQNEEVKTALFRLVDVLPSLSSNFEIISHVNEYFSPLKQKFPALLHRAIDLRPGSLAASIVAEALQKQVRLMASRFIVGDTPLSALPALKKLRKNKLAFTVDLLGEAALSEKEATDYFNRYEQLITCLGAEVPNWKESVSIVPSHCTDRWPVNISVKLSSLYSQSRPVATSSSIKAFTEKLRALLIKAKSIGAFVYLDMEDSSMTSITIETFKQVLNTPELYDYPRVGIVLQAYLRRTADDLNDLLSWVKRRGTPIGVRLVKGAYWDTETMLSKQNGWSVPVWQHKVNSDAVYESLSETLLNNHQLLYPAFGSHNVRSLVYAIEYARHLGLTPANFELQTLYGMGAPIKNALASRGFLIREYAPVGDLLPGMAYLVRRLLENTSNEGFLRQKFHDHQTADALLKKPLMLIEDSGRGHVSKDRRIEFANWPLTDFSLTEERAQLEKELREFRTRITNNAIEVSPILNGEPLTTNQSIDSISPEEKTLKLAAINLANKTQAEKALVSLSTYFPTWRNTAWSARSEIMFRTAEAIARRKSEITTCIILEAGKPWVEADAEVAEAIDFLNYYAHEALKFEKPKKMGAFAGESNEYFYEPRGTTTVISPWNFPFAIPCGMAAAALVTGNVVFFKPAEQTSLTAKFLYDSFIEAGLPPQACAFMPGIGEEVGAFAATHPLVSTVVFTGSMNVGLWLCENGLLRENQGEHVRRVITEMGGKNAIIVDSDADLDEAVRGVVHSAFGYAGQKCSACSRVFVVRSAYERFCDRLKEATLSLQIGRASCPDTVVPPVIDEEAHERVLNEIKSAEGRLPVLATASPKSDEGYYVPPTVFKDVDSADEIISKEIFGPVLCVTAVESFAEAIECANDSKYGLTGAVYSRSPQNIAIARGEFRVGNLYINRGSTGALVWRQPFGGAKMSGVGSKAGGPDYLLQFVIPRVVTENTIRRGFAPNES